KTSLSVLLIAACAISAFGQRGNTDESKVPEYTLPDPLVFEDGSKVENADQWPKRRAEILGLFEEHVYGKVPNQVTRDTVRAEVIKTVPDFHDGKAVLTETRIFFTAKEAPYMDLLTIFPKSAAAEPAPTFLGYNFAGNHAVHPSKEITITKSWTREGNHVATEESRGAKASRWDIDQIINAGCALATIYYGDVDPDNKADQFEDGLHAVYDKPKPNEWGSIATWAWALSVARDHLGTLKEVDQARVAVIGHSRLGKTSLWAGATDERFALVISNNSGCGGAALSRRAFGETVKRINTSFPHWFNDKFNKYNDNEGACPVDQHMLVALSAPRRVYIASAVQDTWADPNGEFLAGKHASPVWELLGKKGVGADKQPEIDTPIGEEVRYHVRTGKHDVLPYDWTQYIEALKTL
ncbi:MAG: acetylxylan esterase, partial [Verrucomicrobiota bacterium]